MKKIRSSKWLLVALGALSVGVLRIGIAWAQQEVMMTGQTSDNPPQTRTIHVDTNGNLITSSSNSTPAGAAAGTHGACTHTTMTIGLAGTTCPPATRADRSSILIQLVQAGQNLRVTEDGVTVAAAAVGINVPDGSSFNDNLAGTVSTSCRCDAAACQVNIDECP